MKLDIFSPHAAAAYQNPQGLRAPCDPDAVKSAWWRPLPTHLISRKCFSGMISREKTSKDILVAMVFQLIGCSS